MDEPDMKTKVADMEKRLTCADPETPVAYTVAEILMEAVKKPGVKFTTISEIVQKLEDLVEVFRLMKNGVILSTFGELFIRKITRHTMKDIHYGEVDNYLRAMEIKGAEFQKIIQTSRRTIAARCAPFILDGQTILTHSHSRVVFEALKTASKKNKKFEVLITESQPDYSGRTMLKILQNEGISCKLIYDAQVGCMMERVDIVLVGADTVAESGGIINKIGCYQMAICAHALSKPFCVLAESFKFTRHYPLNQEDLRSQLNEGDCPTRDYTPPAYIKMLFTDFGILSPSSVSEELIRIYE